MCGSSLLGVDSTNHLCSIVERLLSLEGSLDRRSVTWLPVIPWHMTLVYLLTQTLGTVLVLNMRVKTLLSMVNISISIHEQI